MAALKFKAIFWSLGPQTLEDIQVWCIWGQAGGQLAVYSEVGIWNQIWRFI